MHIETLTSNNGNILKGPYLINPEFFQDSRGWFSETWNQLKFDEFLGKKIIFTQDNHSFSNLGVLRGLHYQGAKSPQAKLLRCVSGSIYDVIVDIRKSSPTFGEWASTILDSKNKYMVWIPIGFAHGFLSLKQNTEVFYKTTSNWNKNEERIIKWNDKNLNIKWPTREFNISKIILSPKDNSGLSFDKVEIFD
tara:strand:+ start:6 stop:584 length:579 start_codon:yes stop_codon:yes gene_type:complete